MPFDTGTPGISAAHIKNQIIELMFELIALYTCEKVMNFTSHFLCLAYSET